MIISIDQFAIDGAKSFAKLSARASFDEAMRRTIPDAVLNRPFSIVLDAPASSETQPDRWKRLMLAAQNGEAKDYATFLREVSPFIRAIARRHHRDPSHIEDVVQETLTSIHRIRHTYERGRPVEPWIAAIAKARSIDVLRTHIRRARRESLSDAESLASHADTSISTEARLVSESAVAEAMENLTTTQRAAVQLLKIDELSLAEASTMSGLSIQALKSSLHRAMKSLRANLTGNNDA